MLVEFKNKRKKISAISYVNSNLSTYLKISFKCFMFKIRLY